MFKIKRPKEKYKTVTDQTRTKIRGMIRLQGGVSNLCCFRHYKQQNVSFMLQEYMVVCNQIKKPSYLLATVTVFYSISRMMKIYEKHIVIMQC